jgi:Glycosyltransferase family 92
MDAEFPPPPEQQGWPDLDYVTYIPWNLNPDMNKRFDIFLFQMAAQVNSILRGRALGLDWIAMNDVDEYIVLRGGGNNTNRTFRDYLTDHLIDEVPTIQGETVSFGNRPGTSGEPQKHMVLDYDVWRSIVTFGRRKRTKCIVRPMYVDYYQIHWISGSTHPVHHAPPDELWIYHYKNPQSGVFLDRLSTKNITMDTTLSDRYTTIVEANVEEILLRMTGSEISALF